MMELNNVSRTTVDILSERTAQEFKWYYSCYISQSINKMQFQYIYIYSLSHAISRHVLTQKLLISY